MIKKARKSNKNHVTMDVFERSMRAIAKSFASQKTVLELILTETKNIHEDNKSFRSNISNIDSEHISRDRRIENLTFRLEKL